MSHHKEHNVEVLNEEGCQIAKSIFEKFKVAKKIGFVTGFNIPDLHTMLLFLEEIEKEKKLLGIETPVESLLKTEKRKY